MSKTPQPGQFGLSKPGGTAGKFINIGQALIGDASRYGHAFIVLDNNEVIGAQPAGARIEPIHKYIGTAVFSEIPLTPEESAKVVATARSMKGIPYSFLDYFALALAHWGVRPQWLVNYITSKGHMICSQLVDEVYRRSGISLFNDGRIPQDITPGDLANWLIERDWVET